MRQRPFLVFASVALGVLYAGLIVALPAGGFSRPGEGARWLQIDSLWRHGWTTLAIDPPGGDLDPEGEFAPDSVVHAGAGLRSPFPVVFPLLASLAYTPLGTRGAWLISAAAAILCMAAGARLARWVVPPGWNALAGVTMVAATPLVVYGAMLREETLGALVAIAALIPILKGHPLASGLLMGLAAAVCPSCAPLIPAAAIAGMIAWGAGEFAGRSLALLAGAAAVLIPRAVYHRVALGCWLAPGEGGGAGVLTAGALAALLLAAEMIPGLRPDPRRRFLVWAAALWMAGSAVFAQAGAGTGGLPADLVPASGALIIALLATVGARRDRRGGRAAVALLGIALGLGLAVQGAGLRRLAAARTYNAAVVERVRDDVPEGGVVLSDLSDVPSLLATLRSSTPALYAPRGADLDSLSARLEAAGRSPSWIVKARTKLHEERGPAVVEAGARYARGQELDLGGGLILLRFEHEAGVRGFMTPPPGD